MKTYLTVGAGRVHLSFPAQKACLLFMRLDGWYVSPTYALAHCSQLTLSALSGLPWSSHPRLFGIVAPTILDVSRETPGTPPPCTSTISHHSPQRQHKPLMTSSRLPPAIYVESHDGWRIASMTVMVEETGMKGLTRRCACYTYNGKISAYECLEVAALALCLA